MTTDVILVLTTCGDEAAAAQLAGSIIEQRLGACVSAIPGVQSIYRWQGRIERATESLLMIKTTRERYEALEDHIRRHSGYELPEVIAVTTEVGLAGWLEWVRRETRLDADAT